ncbi:hypothetical protein ACFY40_00070 [Streptomyces sp. NPDC012950]|uniref:hypothetical protein n=1 Tax=Streptomyces sp. NPDC012950 TaxID=3364858 RepID=UPI00367B3C86
MTVHGSTPLRTLAVVAAVAATTLTGCGAGGDPSVEKANDLLLTTSFHSSGGTTAFAGGSQELWWDPEQGLRMKAVWDGGSGEMYCKDGETYTGAALLADGLKQKGQDVTVPAGMTDVFVTSRAPGGCEVYFRIPDAAERTPASDRTTSKGVRTEAFGVSAGTASDMYYVDSDDSRLVELMSYRDGRFSTTEYDSYGEKFSISMPPDGRRMSMDEFRRRVGG